VADGSQTCPRFPSKIQHRTREDALEHQKRLVFADASVGHPDQSQGLHVYPCPRCSAWYVGHVERLPRVWHYTTCSALDAILDSGALEPSNPRAFVRGDLLLKETDGRGKSPARCGSRITSARLRTLVSIAIGLDPLC
jgi:hypothetical protein